MGIMDFVIIGAAVLFALIGLIKGGAKLFFGFFMLLVIMVGSAFLSSLICPLFLKSEKNGNVTYTGAATVLMKPLGNALPSGDGFGEFLDTVVLEGEDGELYVNEVPLKQSVKDKIPYVGDFLSSFVAKMAHNGETLRKTFSYQITLYIYETAVWIVLVIVFAIIRNIFRKKIFRFLDRHSGPSKVDRLIGVIFNLVILCAVFWGVGAIIANYDDGSNWAHAADNFMTKGVIAKPYMTNNPLLKLMHITLPVIGD